jgi:hypothetical protein
MKSQTSNRMGVFITLAVLMALPAAAKASQLVDFATAVKTIQEEVNRVGQPGPVIPESDEPASPSDTEAGFRILGAPGAPVVKLPESSEVNPSLGWPTGPEIPASKAGER